MQRRFFLTATASLLMASGFLSSPVFAATRVMNTDLVIVGGGLSGIAAAAEATDKGLKPVVLEKLAILGGAGNFPEGSLGIGTRYQKEQGFKGAPLESVAGQRGRHFHVGRLRDRARTKAYGRLPRVTPGSDADFAANQCSVSRTRSALPRHALHDHGRRHALERGRVGILRTALGLLSL